MQTLYSIGIDFGTSNSCVSYAAYFRRDDGTLDPEPSHRPEPIPFQLQNTIPTVLFLGDGKDLPPEFGLLAEERAPYYPELTRSGFKLRLGHETHGKEAFLLAKQFLAHLRQRTAEVLPLDTKDKSIRFETVVGHPVQWTADQREITQRAVEEAGFPDVRLEEESMAALYSHLCGERSGFQPRAGSRILMLDMGGGTTDFAFMQLAMTPDQRPVSIPVDPAPSVAAWGTGRRSYGGRDLDQLMLDYLTRTWDQALVQKNRQALLREVRRFKEAFSERLAVGEAGHETVWLVEGEATPIRLTKAEFEAFAAEYIQHLQVLLKGALEEARLAPRQVTHMLLTGGHSRWYFVQRTLEEVFSHLSVDAGTILRHSQPELSVAKGLAYDPLVRSNRSGVMAPVRRAAHAVWVSVPNGSLSTGRDAVVAQTAAWDEPAILLPRGQTLPFQSRTPLRLRVEQLALDAKEATVRIRFFSGQRRLPLSEREARFERGLWEQFTKTLALRLPWMRALTSDQFEVLVACQVDEHELITAEVLVTRYVGGKPAEVQRQKMRLSTAAA